MALAAALTLSHLPLSSWALGLGRLNVQSALGEALRAEIDISSLTPEEASSLAVRVAPPETYRAAGVDYNAALASAQAVLARRGDGRPYLRVTSDRAIQEPFLDVILELNWSSGRLVREFTLLFDPPGSRAAPPVQATPVSPNLAPAGPSTAAAPSGSTAAAAPRITPSASAAAVPRAATAGAAPTRAPGPDSYQVRNGDSLSRIAGRTQRPGVELDQMLVGLYRANPEAFVERNMNRLRSGVVLAVPPTDAVKAIAPSEAREVIQAQSADFNSYRRRLAEGAPAANTDDAGRQAKGKVTAAVEDKKQAGAAAADKLKLSGGAVKAGGPEGQVSKAAESKDSAARVAELTRNVEELKRLQQGATAAQPGAKADPGAAKSAAAPVAAAPAPMAAAPAAAPAPAPAPVAAPAPVPAPAPAPATVVAAAPAPATVTAAAPAPAPAPAPSPAPMAPAVTMPPPLAAATASAAAPAAPSAKPAAKPPASGSTEPSFLDSLSDSPYLLPGAGALALALLGFGLYRLKSRANAKDQNDTSFLESRVQPDSFFGASGGQRVDTTDQSAGSSSMGFSLSQLDAIGDVDPVAEADVYLAYGRDLQAEEILKEAMRSNPDRMAVRTKLLEVYAKRRDTRGFELLAVQLFSLTKGTGPDWEKAQAMGVQIDPENALYLPGGHPEEIFRDGDRTFVEPLGATTLPATSMPQGMSGFGPTMPPQALDSGSIDLNLDLDLDLGRTAAPSPIGPMETTRPMATQAVPAPHLGTIDFDFTSATTGVPPRQSAPAPLAMDFNLDAISLDLPTIDERSKTLPAGGRTDLSSLDFPDFAVSQTDPHLDTTPGALGSTGADATDPIARKLELADEFRQIGDMEGARDLLEEVIGKSSGALKAKAQSMLNQLG